MSYSNIHKYSERQKIRQLSSNIYEVLETNDLDKSVLKPGDTVIKDEEEFVRSFKFALTFDV